MAAIRSERLYISPVAFRAQINITHSGMIREPDIGMGSVIFRIPEFVRHGKKRRPPGYTAWEIVEPETDLRYRWAAPDALKKEYATDFRGHAKVRGDGVLFEVTYKNTGDEPASDGVSLFCLQAGPAREFHDYDGVNTFVWVKDRFVTVSEIVGGVFPEHRMAGAKYVAADPGERQATRKLMAKRSSETGMVLAVAVDRCSGLSGNFNIWPSCIHANPEWGVLQPGEEATARGKVYFFRGSLEELTERYVRDFET